MGRLLLVRHGQASFGADDYDVLSATGWEQGRVLGRWLREHDVEPTALVRGGLRRHRETLEAVLDGAGWPTPPAPSVDPDWDEFDHVALVGALPGLSDLPAGAVDRREFQRHFEAATERWTAGATTPDVEPFSDFVTRVRRALTAAAGLAGSGQTVLVVSSGGPIGIATAALVDPDDDRPDALARRWSRLNAVTVNTGLTRVVVGSTGARLLTFNEHAHLDERLLTYR